MQANSHFDFPAVIIYLETQNGFAAFVAHSQPCLQSLFNEQLSSPEELGLQLVRAGVPLSLAQALHLPIPLKQVSPALVAAHWEAIAQFLHVATFDM